MSARPKLPPTAHRTRRRHSRAALPAVAMLFSNRRPLGPCIVEDISAGGLLAVTGKAVKPGRVVSVLLDLPGKEALLMFAQVARHECRKPAEHALALSFLELPRAQAEQIEQVVARTLADTHTCLEFFDTDSDGRARRLVLADDRPVVD
jgi:hypothetical protein